METFNIKEDYIINNNPKHYNDMLLTDKWQDEVYLYTFNFMKEHNLKNIVDIGCGSGYKLIKYFDSFDTTGFEVEPCFSFLKKKYPNKRWVESGKPEQTFTEVNSESDVILCCDVIEHIIDPTILIDFINKFEFKYLVISTPDREMLKKISPSGYARSDNGPPVNDAHIREWSFNEFEGFLQRYFNIIDGKRCQKQIECMFFLCTKKI